jgi:hypothetical protein
MHHHNNETNAAKVGYSPPVSLKYESNAWSDYENAAIGKCRRRKCTACQGLMPREKWVENVVARKCQLIKKRREK